MRGLRYNHMKTPAMGTGRGRIFHSFPGRLFESIGGSEAVVNASYPGDLSKGYA